MKPQQKPALVVGLVILAVAAVAFFVGQQATRTFTVMSDDGSAELHIPLRALPEGVAPETITVKRVTVEADGVLARYELQPSGLQFSEPAKLLVRVPFPAQSSDGSLHVDVPTVVIQDETGSGESLTADFAVDRERKLSEVVASIQHFSVVTVLSFLDARIDGIPDSMVDSQVAVGARVTRVRQEVRVPIQNDPNAVAYVFVDEGWHLENGRLISTTTAVTPEIKRDLPERLVPPAGPDGRPAYGVMRYFTCSQVGDARMVYVAYSWVDMKVYAADVQDRRTPIDFDTDGADTDVRLETPQFRCLTSAEESGDEVIIDGGEETVPQPVVIRASKGEWEALVTASKLRVAVGESFTVDVSLTDVTDRLLATIPEADRAQYRTPWEVEGTWHVVDGIYDRTPTVPAARREVPYGGRLTYQLPVRCEHPGVGPISLELSVGRVMQRTPSIVPGLPARAELRLPAVYVECLAPITPPEDQVEPDRLKVSPSTIQETHRVGTSSCPQKMATVRIDGPAGGEWSATGIPTWIDMPSYGPFGDVDVYFNCEIEDTSPHDEKASITIKSGDVEESIGVGVQVRD